jgi:predicted transcriptional regulator
MNTANESPANPQIPTPLPFYAMVAALGDPTRWAIMAELSSGEPRMVKEIAQRLGRQPAIISKHLAMLKRANMVVTGRGRLWQIPAQFVAVPDQRQVDFGYCLLRLPPADATFKE